MQLLLGLLAASGFGAAYAQRYHMMSKFYVARLPLLVAVYGAPCTGKSLLAARLVQTLNLPNVLQLDALAHAALESRRGTPGGECSPLAALMPPQGPPEGWRAFFERGTEAYDAACAVVTGASYGEIRKAVCDGKPLLVEGAHTGPHVIDWAVALAHGGAKQWIAPEGDSELPESSCPCRVVHVAVCVDAPSHAGLLRQFLHRRGVQVEEQLLAWLVDRLQEHQARICRAVARSNGIQVHLAPSTRAIEEATKAVQATVLAAVEELDAQ